jgi:hypothetical protein
VTSSKDRGVGAYSMDLIIPGNSGVQTRRRRRSNAIPIHIKESEFISAHHEKFLIQ